MSCCFIWQSVELHSSMSIDTQLCRVSICLLPEPDNISHQTPSLERFELFYISRISTIYMWLSHLKWTHISLVLVMKNLFPRLLAINSEWFLMIWELLVLIMKVDVNSVWWCLNTARCRLYIIFVILHCKLV